MPPIASTRREQSFGLFLRALRRLVSKRQGVASSPPPLPGRVMENALPGRGPILASRKELVPPTVGFPAIVMKIFGTKGNSLPT